MGTQSSLEQNDIKIEKQAVEIQKQALQLREIKQSLIEQQTKHQEMVETLKRQIDQLRLEQEKIKPVLA